MEKRKINTSVSWISARLQEANLLQQIVLAIIFCLLINFFVSLIPLRFDASKQQAYSLSTATKKILARVSTPITITAYMSSDIPSRLLPLKRDVIDFLNEYASESGGKIKIVIKDPRTNSDAQAKAIKAGVPQIQFSEVAKDQYKVSSSFFGLTVHDGKTVGVIPQVVTVSTLEYDITSIIYKTTRVLPQKVALINFPTTNDPRLDSFSSLKRSLGKQFDIADVKLSTEAASLDPKTIKAAILVIDGTNNPIRQTFNTLSNYIENGGALLVFVDGMSVSEGLAVSPATHDMFEFLRRYGIVLNRNLALSFSAQSATFATGLGAFVMKYPLWIATHEFAKSSTDFANISQLVFPWASSLTITDPAHVRALVQSPSNSWVQQDKFVLVPNGIPAPKENELLSYPLVVEGNIGTSGKLLVVSTARFAREQYLSRSEGNIEFVVNLLNRYASSGALSGIRSRASISNPLKPLKPIQKEIVRYSIIGILPGLFLLFGMLRLYRRGKMSM